MRILYVTEMWTGLAGVLIQGETVPKGMPAFFRPLERLVKDGNQIDMLIYETDQAVYNKPISPTLDWMKKIRYYRCFLPINRTGILKPVSQCSKVFTIYHKAKRILEENHYDLVYGHGHFSEAVGVAASKKGIPFGQRRYGDSIALILSSLAFSVRFAPNP